MLWTPLPYFPHRERLVLDVRSPKSVLGPVVDLPEDPLGRPIVVPEPERVDLVRTIGKEVGEAVLHPPEVADRSLVEQCLYVAPRLAEATLVVDRELDPAAVALAGESLRPAPRVGHRLLTVDRVGNPRPRDIGHDLLVGVLGRADADHVGFDLAKHLLGRFVRSGRVDPLLGGVLTDTLGNDVGAGNEITVRLGLPRASVSVRDPAGADDGDFVPCHVGPAPRSRVRPHRFDPIRLDTAVRLSTPSMSVARTTLPGKTLRVPVAWLSYPTSRADSLPDTLRKEALNGGMGERRVRVAERTVKDVLVAVGLGPCHWEIAEPCVIHPREHANRIVPPDS